MNEKSGLNKLYWGFLFIMLTFRIQGFDILPDIVGYLLFAMGFRELASSSTYFSIAAKYNIPMIILSIFSFVLIFIPLLGVIYIIVLLVISIILAISIMRFLKRCS